MHAHLADGMIGGHSMNDRNPSSTLRAEPASRADPAYDDNGAGVALGAGDGADDQLTHHPPLRERVRVRLEQMIADGMFEPGQHLVETDLARRLGVSRGPIREALHLLQLQGWVDLRPRQGAFVHQPSAVEIDQFFGVRALLESEAAALAAGNATPEAITAMRRAIEAAWEAIDAGDERALMSGNAIFHGHVHKLAGNKVLQELVELLDKRIRWFFSPVAMERAKDAWREHEELVDAIAKGDRGGAAVIIRQHTERTRVAYVRRLELRNPEADSGA